MGVAFYVSSRRWADGSYDPGHTEDLEKRIAARQRGAISGYTSVRRPVHLVFSDSFAEREEAFGRGRQIKGWTRQKKEALIHGDWNQLIQLSEA